jgi:hypothetical protein
MKDNKESSLFGKTESEMFWDRLMNGFSQPSIDQSLQFNAFVENADETDDAISPLPKIMTRSSSARNILSILNRQASVSSLMSFKKPSEWKAPDRSEPMKIQKEEHKTTVSDKEENNKLVRKINEIAESPKKKTPTKSKRGRKPGKGSRKKRKRRRDVIFKTILRECRRYFQIHLTDLTGFISSKKVRTDDYMYKCMERFNKEALHIDGNFEENFYLAWLLYPQDLIRNVESFVQFQEGSNTASNKNELKETAAKIHDTLYKYSHDKLEFFVSKPQLCFYFCYFYEKGAGTEKEDSKYAEEYELIRGKCMDTLNKWE